jgi:hypothetical protein
LIVDRGEVVGRDKGELSRLRSVVDGLWAHGGRPALVAVGEEGVEIWTYGELAWRVLGLGRGLRGAGVERGDHVALLAANSKEWVAACLAVISAGAVVVPLDVQLGDGQEHVRSQPDIERGPCSLRVEDLENMPAGSPYIMAPNHVSYLDAFAVAAALDYSVLRCTYLAGAAFGHTLTRLVSTGLRCSSAVRTWSGSPKVYVHPQEACSRSSRAWERC